MTMLKSVLSLAAAAAFLAAAPAAAQVETIDPNQAYQTEPVQAAPEAAPDEWNAQNPAAAEWAPAEPQPAETLPADPAVEPFSEAVAQPGESAAAPASEAATVPRDDVFSAAESVFGAGAEGLARLLEDILHEQGEPTAYISGQEAGGAFVVGVRYGSGTMHHQIEGDRAVYWTGPSLGFDFGADANKVFVLVYNLHDSQDLFKRFPGAEGHAYFVGGFNAQYLRRGDVVLIPIRMGVGLRLGINAGYMRFSQRNRWLPF